MLGPGCGKSDGCGTGAWLERRGPRTLQWRLLQQLVGDQVSGVGLFALRSEAERCCRARTRVYPSRAVHRELEQWPAGRRQQDAEDGSEEGLSATLPLATVRTFLLLGWAPSSVSTVLTFTLSLGKHETLFCPQNSLREWESRAWQPASLLLLRGSRG